MPMNTQGELSEDFIMLKKLASPHTTEVPFSQYQYFKGNTIKPKYIQVCDESNNSNLDWKLSLL